MNKLYLSCFLSFFSLSLLAMNDFTQFQEEEISHCGCECDKILFAIKLHKAIASGVVIGGTIGILYAALSNKKHNFFKRNLFNVTIKIITPTIIGAFMGYYLQKYTLLKDAPFRKNYFDQNIFAILFPFAKKQM